jgi:hypothetical protein
MHTLDPARRPRPRRRLARLVGALGAGTAALVASVAVAAAPPALAGPASGITFVGTPGTGAPPGTLGPYVMQPFGADSQPTFTSVSGVTGPTGAVSFSPALEHVQVGSGWATWSNGYTGDVYETGGGSITLTLPNGTGAFYLYAEPDEFSNFSVSATTQDGTSSGPVTVNGSSGATYFGFYASGSSTISTITVSASDPEGFAIGEFGVSNLGNGPVTAVRFAPVKAAKPGTPGLPVIKDDGPSTELDHQFGPASCAGGLASPSSYDYLNCASPASGGPDKDWPVIYPAGSGLTIDQAVFTSATPLTSPALTATATIGGQTLTLASTPLTSAAVGGHYELSASDLAFTGTLPATPGLDQLAISWTISAGGTTVPAFSAHEIYVTAAPYVTPTGATEILPPYVSLLDVGTKAAAGASGPQAVFNAIWKQFDTLNIAHPILNPVTGLTTSGPDFQYYANGYQTIADWWNDPIGPCPLFATMLATNSGHCGNWAEFLANALAYQGITSKAVTLDNTDFYPGPSPDAASHTPADGYAFMLIDPALWSFTAKGTGPYPYTDSLSVANGQLHVLGGGVTYNPSTTPIAQGQVDTPPEMFFTGDHEIVQTQWGYAGPPSEL